MKKINILGTEYRFEHDDSIKEQGFDGLCKTYEKEITVRSAEDMLESSDPPDAKQERYAETLRHEIVHAFFFEAGLDVYCDDEVLVTWISKQFPKLFDAFVEVDAI